MNERSLFPSTRHTLLRSVMLAGLAVFPLACGQAGVSESEGLGFSQEAVVVGPSLGTAESFAALAGSTVTNTGSTTVTGDLGVSPGLAITGFPPGIVNGTLHSGDATAAQAQSDVTTAYDALAGEACSTDLTGQDLGGLTLTPGVYCFSSSAQLTGTLTLDAQGDPNAVFIFQIGSTLTTASNASVVVTNNAQPCNVYWQVGSSATLGTGTAFTGNILALTSITLTTGASVDGRALAQNGALTMDSNDVAMASCAGPVCTSKDRVSGKLLNTVGSMPTDISFNVWASLVNGVISGTFCFRDEVAGTHAHSESITSYTINGTTRVLSGQASIEHIPGYTFALAVTDGGAIDTYSLSLSDGYTSTGSLPANNIQVNAAPACP